MKMVVTQYKIFFRLQEHLQVFIVGMRCLIFRFGLMQYWFMFKNMLNFFVLGDPSVSGWDMK